MKVTVFGASGRTGRPLIQKLLAAGHEVIAASRSTADLVSAWDLMDDRSGGLEIREADVSSEGSVRSAVRGADVVVAAIAPPLHRHLVRPTTLYSESGRNLVCAMSAEQVRRLIVVSSAGVVPDDPNHPPIYRYVLKPVLFDRALYRDMRIMEQVVSESELRWTCVRASGLTDGTETGSYRIGTGQLPDRGSRISRRDLAAFLAGLTSEETYVGAYPTVAY